MYEEKRTDLSTHNTSYALIDLKEEYLRRKNELELEKEELEFYRMKYKKKQQKLNQDKRLYKSTLTEIVKKQTPQHTEESSDDEIRIKDPLSGPTIMKKKLSQDNQKKVMHKTLNNQVALDLRRLKDDRANGKIKTVKFSSTFDWMSVNSDSSRGGLRVEDLQEEPGSDTLELRFTSNQFETPRRVLTPSQMGCLTGNSSSRSSKNMERVLFD